MFMVPARLEPGEEGKGYPWYVQAVLVLFTILSVPALIALPFWLSGFLVSP
jgi:hypothetical protein